MNEIKMLDFIEKCELELINQLCKNCPSTEQIEKIAEDFSKEIDRQLVDDGLIVGN